MSLEWCLNSVFSLLVAFTAPLEPLTGSQAAACCHSVEQRVEAVVYANKCAEQFSHLEVKHKSPLSSLVKIPRFGQFLDYPSWMIGYLPSVHNYSTYPMLLHKCSKNVVSLNEICSKYVVNLGKKCQICSIHSFIHHKFYMPKKCPNKH